MPSKAASSNETAGKHDPRLRRILHGGASSLLERGAALAISAISLPLTVRYLGPQRYGIWVTISSMVVMLQVMDFGLANSLTNMISRAYARNDKNEAQRYYATALWSCTAIAAMLGLIAFSLWPHVRWGAFFKVSGTATLSREVSRCLAIALTFFLTSLPLNLVNRVLSGYQQTQISNYFNLLSNALGLVAILVVMHLHGSLVMLLAVYSATLMLGTVALNIWMNFFARPWLRPRPGAIHRAFLRELFGSGFGFFLLTLAGMVVVNSDNLVIAHYLGAANVVPYSVTWKLAGYAAVLQTAIFPSLWPAYTEAYERGDYTWVRRTFWRAAKLAMGTVTLALASFAVLGRWLIRLYVGPDAVPTEMLLLAICLWIVISTAMDLEACFLAAINRVRLQGVLSVVAAVLNLGLSIYFVKRIGPLGVVLGTILSYVLTLIGPQTWIVYRGLYHPPGRMTPERSMSDLQHG